MEGCFAEEGDKEADNEPVFLVAEHQRRMVGIHFQNLPSPGDSVGGGGLFKCFFKLPAATIFNGGGRVGSGDTRFGVCLDFPIVKQEEKGIIQLDFSGNDKNDRDDNCSKSWIMTIQTNVYKATRIVGNRSFHGTLGNQPFCIALIMTRPLDTA